MWQQLKKNVLTKVVLLLALFAASGVMVANAAGTFKNEPNGFADLYWGESLDSVKATHYVKYQSSANNVDIYAVVVDDAKGDLYLKGRVLTFVSFKNNRIHNIKIPLMGTYTKMIQPLSNIYGSPSINNMVMKWEGSKTIMLLGPLSLEKNDGLIILFDASQQ